MKKLELFYFDSCPFCQRVLAVIDELDIKVELKDILEDPKNLNRLMNDTGQRMVPCLYIDNKPMFESADIVEWLRENESTLEKRSGSGS